MPQSNTSSGQINIPNNIVNIKVALAIIAFVTIANAIIAFVRK